MSGRLVIKDGPRHVREAVRAIIVGQMAGHLIAHQIDLKDRRAVRAALVDAGFGEPSVTALMERAVAAAS